MGASNSQEAAEKWTADIVFDDNHYKIASDSDTYVKSLEGLEGATPVVFHGNNKGKITMADSGKNAGADGNFDVFINELKSMKTTLEELSENGERTSEQHVVGKWSVEAKFGEIAYCVSSGTNTFTKTVTSAATKDVVVFTSTDKGKLTLDGSNAGDDGDRGLFFKVLKIMIKILEQSWVSGEEEVEEEEGEETEIADD